MTVKCFTTSMVAIIFGLLPAYGQNESNMQEGSTSFRVTQELSDCSGLGADPGVILRAVNLPLTGPAIIHFVEWKKGDEYSEKWLTVDPDSSQNESKRLFGRHEIIVLAMHKGVDPGADIAYQIEVKKKLPSWIQNAASLLTLRPVRCRYGYVKMTNVPTPSDITVKGSWSLPAAAPAPSSGPTGAGTGGATAGTGTGTGGGLAGSPLVNVPTSGTADPRKLAFSETFDNEGKYWADFSVGLPVLRKKVTDFELVDGVLRRKDAARTDAYGFLNVFLKKRDTKAEDFLRVPHVMLGLPLSGRTLDSPVAALGLGFARFGIKFDVYAGCVFNRTTVAAASGTGTDVRWVRKLTVGLNLPVSQFISTYLKKK